MKYHIALKFLAVLLCAASLLGAVGSALGILALTELDLYNKTVDQVLDEQIRDKGSFLAQLMALRYASRTLGSCPEELIENYYLENYYPTDWLSTRFGSCGYSILDEEGNVLEGQLPDSAEGYQTYTFPVSGQYMYLVSVTPESKTYPQAEPVDLDILDQYGDYGVYDAVPEAGAEVYGMSVSYEQDSSAGVSGVEPIGFLFRKEDGNVVFRSYDSGLLDIPWSADVTNIAFVKANGEVIYSASDPEGVGVLSYTDDDSGRLVFVSSISETPEVMTVSVAVFLDENRERLWGSASEEGVGVFYYDEDGYAYFEAGDVEIIDPRSTTVAGVEFYGEDGTLIYTAFQPEGLGSFFYNSTGTLIFSTYTPVYAARTAADDSTPSGSVTEPQSEDVPDETAVSEDGSGEDAAQEDAENTAEQTEETVPSSASAAPEETAVPDETAAPTATEAETATEAPTEAPALPAETVPETTAAPTLPAETVPETTEPLIINGKTLDEFEINRTSYYDSDAGETMIAEYVYTPMPEYTVELYIVPGAMRYESVYTVLRVVRTFRNDLFLVLGVSLLLFAVMVVYLCCAAGRKPKSTEVHAGGLNCLPLDLYLGLACGAFAGIYVAGVEGTEYLLRQSIQTGCVYAVAAAFSACLIFVGFCFAFVAQVKTPGGYWWHNCLCVRFLTLLVRFAVCLEKFLATRFFPGSVRFLKALWKGGVRLLQAVYYLIKRVLKRIFGGLWNLIRRFFSLLPLTWQWLLVGCMMIFIMAITANSYNTGVVLIGVGITLGIILYAAHCFGFLMECTRRMSKGDLDTKVEDKLLVGCFEEFAGDLNDLADVAVVAAQKQLKSERMKTELITNVSHDIKTPLTSIINYVDLMQKPHTDEEQEMYLEVLSRQSLRLKKLIEDLMEMSKASTGNMTVEVMQVDAVESVNQALGEFADKLDKAQLTPVFRHAEESLAMMADGRLVWRVMSNLLSNAVKYAMPGTRLYIDLMELEGKVVISLKNISRDELNVDADELMERFVRGDDSRNTEGSGLGLNIAKSLMELQKGQLQLLVDGDLFKVTLIFPSA
ncbi:MAG: HAMP domain-containing sensor histidine kinase [Eubacteriales bacterium]|nr:HAMP domain-containing sensor histidine kinase [Eubacteriales bacterium]